MAECQSQSQSKYAMDNCAQSPKTPIEQAIDIATNN